MDLQNKKILILGGTGSIGGAVADALEKMGAQVARHGLSSGEFRADLSQDGEAKRFVDLVIAKFGTIDVVINSISALLRLMHIKQRTWSDYQAQLNVQLRAAVEVTKEVVPIMDKAGGGVILHVITSAVEEELPPSHMADYVTAKYALLGFAKASARELERFGIKVLYINPGFIKNDFTSGFPEKAVEIIQDKGEIVTEQEVAEKIVSSLQGL